VSFDGNIPLRIELDGRPIRSETVYAQAGAYALTIITTLPDAGLPVELHSTYVGHPGAPTRATHLHLGPEARAPRLETAEHDEHDICVVFTPRNAAYDHAHELLLSLQELGRDAAVHVPDDAFARLEAVLGRSAVRALPHAS
jgi:hypothetical protein